MKRRTWSALCFMTLMMYVQHTALWKKSWSSIRSRADNPSILGTRFWSVDCKGHSSRIPQGISRVYSRYVKTDHDLDTRLNGDSPENVVLQRLANLKYKTRNSPILQTNLLILFPMLHNLYLISVHRITFSLKANSLSQFWSPSSQGKAQGSSELSSSVWWRSATSDIR